MRKIIYGVFVLIGVITSFFALESKSCAKESSEYMKRKILYYQDISKNFKSEDKVKHHSHYSHRSHYSHYSSTS